MGKFSPRKMAKDVTVTYRGQGLEVSKVLKPREANLALKRKTLRPKGRALLAQGTNEQQKKTLFDPLNLKKNFDQAGKKLETIVIDKAYTRGQKKDPATDEGAKYVRTVDAETGKSLAYLYNNGAGSVFSRHMSDPRYKSYLNLKTGKKITWLPGNMIQTEYNALLTPLRIQEQTKRNMAEMVIKTEPAVEGFQPSWSRVEELSDSSSLYTDSSEDSVESSSGESMDSSSEESVFEENSQRFAEGSRQMHERSNLPTVRQMVPWCPDKRFQARMASRVLISTDDKDRTPAGNKGSEEASSFEDPFTQDSIELFRIDTDEDEEESNQTRNTDEESKTEESKWCTIM